MLAPVGTVSQPSDEIVVESVHLAEANALLAFQVTASDLNKAVKSLAKDILGERAGSTTKRSLEITEFIKTSLASVGKKTSDELRVVQLLGILRLLKTKVVDFQLESKAKTKEAKKCLSVDLRTCGKHQLSFYLD